MQACWAHGPAPLRVHRLYYKPHRPCASITGPESPAPKRKRDSRLKANDTSELHKQRGPTCKLRPSRMSKSLGPSSIVIGTAKRDMTPANDCKLLRARHQHRGTGRCLHGARRPSFSLQCSACHASLVMPVMQHLLCVGSPPMGPKRLCWRRPPQVHLHSEASAILGGPSPGGSPARSGLGWQTSSLPCSPPCLRVEAQAAGGHPTPPQLPESIR